MLGGIDVGIQHGHVMTVTLENPPNIVALDFAGIDNDDPCGAAVDIRHVRVHVKAQVARCLLMLGPLVKGPLHAHQGAHAGKQHGVV